MEIDFEKINDEIKINNKLQLENVIESTELMILSEMKISLFLEKTENFEIIDRDSAKECLSMSLQARKMKQALNKKRLEVIKPHFEFQKSINKFSKNFEDKLLEIEQQLTDKLKEFIKLNNDQSYLSILNQSMQVADGKISTKKYWEFKIEEEEMIPRKFLSIDEKKIRKAIDSGVRKIDGVKIFETDKLNLRVNNSIEKYREYEL